MPMILENNPLLTALVFCLVLDILLYALTGKAARSLSFLLPAPLLLLFYSGYWNINKLLVTGAIVLWGLKLGSDLFHKKDRAGNDTKGLSLPRLLQAFTAWLVMTPFILFLTHPYALGWFYTTLGGLLLCFFGLIFEGINDFRKFQVSKKEKGRSFLLQSGSLGEILFWWGLFLVVIPSLEGIGWLSILGPLAVTLSRFRK
jgi:steroid 5-alpha reductase family enzyme